MQRTSGLFALHTPAVFPVGGYFRCNHGNGRSEVGSDVPLNGINDTSNLEFPFVAKDYQRIMGKEDIIFQLRAGQKGDEATKIYRRVF